ncbi:LysR substrate-binding domain-containing protein [Rhizobium sp. HT1-10]|uniref:LysR substrate-binding domain-containing protein n=1 Tax=Rhizobium sp. HT1-10 TaxID=3111638 RepID=UPI003C2D75C3
MCASPSYLAAYGKPTTIEDLDNHKCARRASHYGPEFAPWRFSRPETGEPFERSVQGTLSFDSPMRWLTPDCPVQALLQLHTYMAEPHIKSGALVEVLPAFAADGPPISVLFPSSRSLAPKVRAFIDS